MGSLFPDLPVVVHPSSRLLYPFLTNSERNGEGEVYRHPTDDGKEKKGKGKLAGDGGKAQLMRIMDDSNCITLQPPFILSTLPLSLTRPWATLCDASTPETQER